METYPEDFTESLQMAEIDGLTAVLEEPTPGQECRVLVGFTNTHGGGSTVSYFPIADKIEQIGVSVTTEHVVTDTVVLKNKYGNVYHVDVYWRWYLNK